MGMFQDGVRLYGNSILNTVIVVVGSVDMLKSHSIVFTEHVSGVDKVVDKVFKLSTNPQAVSLMHIMYTCYPQLVHRIIHNQIE